MVSPRRLVLLLSAIRSMLLSVLVEISVFRCINKAYNYSVLYKYVTNGWICIMLFFNVAVFFQMEKDSEISRVGALIVSYDKLPEQDVVV